MAESPVYLTDLRAKPGRNMLDKFRALLEKAGALDIDYDRKYVALKLHFGEPGNLAFIRPNYVAVAVEMVTGAGGKAFLTDTNTLYTGGRSNAVDHLKAAAENGFNRLAVGCDVIIADGLKGASYREIEIGQKHCRAAKIASSIADADVLITLSHFKGHEMTGIGGALKNLGMGCASVGGKLEMHSSSKPEMRPDKCVKCGMCISFCPAEAITPDDDGRARIDYDKCIGCGQCVAMCQYNAVRVKFDQSASVAAEKMAEYALAALEGKQYLHVNFITDVSPFCDCWPHNDAPLVADIGIAASHDPVALDRASTDLVNRAPALEMSTIGEDPPAPGEDKFGRVHPNTSWQMGLDYAEGIGLGTQSYRVISIDGD